jgi:hypothetical protein
VAPRSEIGSFSAIKDTGLGQGFSYALFDTFIFSELKNDSAIALPFSEYPVRPQYV